MDDEDNRFDLYIRGASPINTENGGPWTIVENWQGVQGYSLRWLQDPYLLSETPIHIASNRIDFILTPSNDVMSGDIVMDSEFSIGVISSAQDGSGDYLATRVTSKAKDRIDALAARVTALEEALRNRATNQDIDDTVNRK